MSLLKDTVDELSRENAGLKRKLEGLNRVLYLTHGRHWATCSICDSRLTPLDSPGSWQCHCIYDPVSGKGHWDKPKIVIHPVKRRKDPT